MDRVTPIALKTLSAAPAPHASPSREKTAITDPVGSTLRKQGTTIRLGFDAPQGIDHRRVQQRETVEKLLLRCEHLQLEEQALVRSVYADKRTIREIALMQKRDERAVRRELRRLVKRMLRPEFAIVLMQAQAWAPTRSRVGESIFLHGNGLRSTATLLSITVHNVRTHVSAIRAIADAVRRSRKQPFTASTASKQLAHMLGGAA